MEVANNIANVVVHVSKSEVLPYRTFPPGTTYAYGTRKYRPTHTVKMQLVTFCRISHVHFMTATVCSYSVCVCVCVCVCAIGIAWNLNCVGLRASDTLTRFLARYKFLIYLLTYIL